MHEIRFDVMSGAFAVIAAERAKRPSDWKAAQKEQAEVPEKDPKCPFCPGNERETPPEVAAIRDSGGADEPGWRVRVVPNKFPALSPRDALPEEEREMPSVPSGVPEAQEASIYWRSPGLGAHEVVVESSSHAGTLGTYTDSHVKDILLMLKERVRALYDTKDVKYVQVFKNHGERGGASLSHPHFQIIGLPVMPTAVANEATRQRDYEAKTGRCLFCDMVEREIEKDVRVINKTAEFAVLAPFASRYSFETLIVPRKHISSLAEATPEYLFALAGSTVDLFERYEAMFSSLPYNVVFHGIPSGPRATRNWPYHAHIHVYPRLGWEAGLELGTGVFINPSPPEDVTKQFIMALEREKGYVHA